MYNFNALFGPASAASRKISPTLLAPEFGEVSVRPVGDRIQVVATLAMGAYLLGDGERCMVGLALDASQSMQDDYGRGRTIPSDVSKEYIAKGMYEEVVRDGVARRVLTKEAKEQAIRSGRVQRTRNIVHEPCLTLIDNLIRTFATGGVTSGGCEVIYWACGKDGREIESLGEIHQGELATTTIEGPRTKAFGAATHLTPPFRYFWQQAAGVNGVFVFVTDGHIDDEAQVVSETHRLAAEIKAGRRKFVKCVLLGIGTQVDRDQLARLDDMEMPEDLADVDIWNATVLSEMRHMNDAWSEIFDPETVVGTSLRVFNEQNRLVYEKTDEVKALMWFDVPADTAVIELVLDGEMKIRQSLQ